MKLSDLPFLKWTKYTDKTATGLKLNYVWHLKHFGLALIAPLGAYIFLQTFIYYMEVHHSESMKFIRANKEKSRAAYLFDKQYLGTQTLFSLIPNTEENIRISKNKQANQIYEDISLINKDLDRIERELTSVYLEIMYEKQEKLAQQSATNTHKIQISLDEPSNQSLEISIQDSDCDFIHNIRNQISVFPRIAFKFLKSTLFRVKESENDRKKY